MISRQPSMPHDIRLQNALRIAVAIPTFNSAAYLSQALKSLVDCGYKKRLIRVIFVDNYSSDGTLQIINEFTEKYSEEFEVIIVIQARTNIPQARNICLEHAQNSDYIFFLDSDIAIPPDTFTRLLRLFEERGNVGIASLHQADINAVKRANFLLKAFKSPTGVIEAYKVSNGCNLLSMEAVRKVGDFNVKLPEQEDGEYCYRVRKNHYKVLCDFGLEGLHLKEERVDLRYYLRFILNSSRTYIELAKRRSPVHIARYLSTVVSLVALGLLILTGSTVSALLFVSLLIFMFWLNTSRIVLDDGIEVKLKYRPIVAPITTLLVAVIVVISLGRLILRKR